MDISFGEARAFLSNPLRQCRPADTFPVTYPPWASFGRWRRCCRTCWGCPPWAGVCVDRGRRCWGSCRCGWLPDYLLRHNTGRTLDAGHPLGKLGVVVAICGVWVRVWVILLRCFSLRRWLLFLASLLLLLLLLLLGLTCGVGWLVVKF